MKSKIKLVVVMSVVAIFSLTTTCFSATMYDKGKNGEYWKAHVTQGGKIKESKMLYDYVYQCVTEKDVIQMAKSKKFNKEQSKFMLKNSSDFTKVMQIEVLKHVAHLAQMKDQPLTDETFIYVTGMIKNPKRRLAKNSTEKQVEEIFWRESAIYAIWEGWKQKDRELFNAAIVDTFAALE